MNSAIRVLHVIDKLTMDGINPSSCARLFVEWIPRHDSSRFRAKVANLCGKDLAGEYLERQGVEVFYVGKGKFSLANIRAITDLIDREAIDILHLHGYSSANFGRIAAHRKRIPAIVHEHAVLRILPHQFLADRLLRSRTDVAVAVSNAVGDFLVKGRSVPREKIRVIWNGINLSTWCDVDQKKTAAFRLQYAREGQRLVGTVTRLRKEKGNRYFIEAAATIAREMPDVCFVIVGDGPERKELESMAATFEIRDRLKFAGYIEEVPAALAALDLVVVPSLREGFGLALAEAMAAGRPVVASNVGGMCELATHDQDALLVPPADSVALAAAMLRLLRNKRYSDDLAAAARRRSESFSVERNLHQLESLYMELADHSHSSSGAIC